MGPATVACVSSSTEHPHLVTIGMLTALQERYVNGELLASEFAEAFSAHVTEDFVFACRFTPASDLLKPLFADRHGIGGLLDRYRIEEELERIEPGTTMPEHVAVSDDCFFMSMRETASFGGGPKVTFDVVTKFVFAGDKVARIEMFLDGRPIDAAYPE